MTATTIGPALFALVLAGCSGCGASSTADGTDGGSGGSADAGPLAACEPSDPGAISMVEIATWRFGASAAYSMIHDDMCDYGVRGIHEHAVDALRRHGLTAGLGPIVAECEAQSLWDQVTAAEAAGNEIVNHSYTHPEITMANAPMEVAGAKQAFEEHTEQPVTFYIFPYDYATADTIAAVGNAGHIGARAGNRDDNDGFDNPPLNPATPDNDLTIEFDVWPRTYSKYALYAAEDMLRVHVWNAIERGAWAVREFHSVIADSDPVEGNGFGPIALGPYERHLEFLADARAANLVWTAGPSTVIRYRHARTACGAAVEGNTIVYDTSSAECVEFATPITVIVETATDVPRLDATQNGNQVSSLALGERRFAITADPTAGPVELAGCANPGHAVDRDRQVAPRPQPAASVCDLETVVGNGGAGRMDDLERPADEFQVLPNPRQDDGRTGSWSWYPQAVDVEMVADGDNTHLRYAGSGLAAWTGVTLAFLGGNGAGSCYDASAYQGIRFRIKGSVTGGDLAGKVIVSLVTAATQSRRFGGNLDGEGGHFHHLLTVPSEWQTVSIPFASLSKPTWGDTVSLTAPAVRELQAIDWGISDTATNFEILLDDIELY